MRIGKAIILLVFIAVSLIPQQAESGSQSWGDDVLVHQADCIYGFGLDQADKDTLILVVSDSSTSNLKDTLYVYRSTDDGQSWNCVTYMFPVTDNLRHGKADVISAKGDSNFVFMFLIRDTGAYKGLWCTRFNHSFAGSPLLMPVSTSENVMDFDICQDLYSNYWLYVVYQTDLDSVIFKSSRDYGKTWQTRKNLTETTPLKSQPKVAWSQGPYLVVAGKTDEDKIYTIRNDNSGQEDDWKDGQYPSGLGSCEAPVIAASHTKPDSQAVFWLFYERYVGLSPLYWMTNFQWSTNAGASWYSLSSPNDTSSCNRLYPSLHVLKENDVSNITFAYRYEGTYPRQIRYIYKENAQAVPSVWNVSYSGINDYAPDYRPPQKAYTIRGIDNSIRSAILYVHATDHDLYFDASFFTDVEEEFEDQAISRFNLGQNYPNPFNLSTKIEFTLVKSGYVSLEIYDLLGRKVRSLVSEYLPSGHRSVLWDGKNDSGKEVASGIYFYQLRTDDFTEAKKLVLLK